MGFIDSGSKSSRLLASRRYTHNTFTTAQESFTNVLDLRGEEIYTQAQYVPSSDLPYSGSSQVGSILQASGSNLLKYWYRHKLTPSNVNREVWFFLNPTGSSDGVGAQLINDNQEVNFISPKYSISSLANSTTEDATPGYGVVVHKSSTYTEHTQTGSLGSSDKISGNDYQFDYKTGVLQFVTDSVDPASNEAVFITAYQYVGTTLATGLDIAGYVTASAFKGDGSGLTGLSSDSVSVAFADISGKPALLSGSGQIADDISGSFNAGFETSGTISGSKDIFVGSFGSTYISGSNGNISASTADLGGNITSKGTISGSVVYGTTIGQNRSDGLKTITIEDTSTINQDVTTDATPTFAGINTTGNIVSQGDVIAENYIVSSSVTYMTQSFASGSNIFGDDILDTHQFTGSINQSGSFTLNSGDMAVTDTLTATNIGAYNLSGKLTAGSTEIEGSNFDINGGTIDGVSNVNSTGTITGSAVYGTTIGQNRVDGVKTITIESNSTINQDVTSDANVTFGTISSGNVTSTGTVSGSAVYGTTIGQNRVDGVKTLTIESNSTVNQDLTTDANVQFNHITASGTITGSAVYGTTIGQNRVDGVKTITIEANSTVNQDLTTDANPTFADLTLTGDLTVRGDTTTLSTTNLKVQDAFVFTATGSAGTNVDGGLIVQSGSAVDSGSAIYHDTQDERWAVGKGVAADGTAVTPTAYITTTTTANHNPNTDSGSYGSGEMWINTSDEEIWVRTG